MSAEVKGVETRESGPVPVADRDPEGKGAMMRMMRSGVWIVALVTVALAASAMAGDGDEPIDPKYKAFAEDIEARIARGDASAIDGQFDIDVLLDRMFEDTDITAADKTAIGTGMRGAMNVGQNVVMMTRGGGSYTLKRLHRKKKDVYALFRLIGANRAVNFHDILLQAKPDGSVVIADMYIFAPGQMFSDLLEGVLLPVLRDQNKGLFSKLFSSEDPYVKHFNDVASMGQAVQSQNPAGALKTFDSLPEAVQKMKIVQMLRFRAAMAMGVDSKEYRAALTDIKRLFSDDPGMQLLLVDHYLFQKEYDKCHECLNALGKAVGGDAYVQILHASSYMAEEKNDKAFENVDKAIELEPAMQFAHDLNLGLALKTKDWARVSTALDLGEKHLGVTYEPGRIEGLPAFAEYVKTDEYAAWKKAHETE